LVEAPDEDQSNFAHLPATAPSLVETVVSAKDMADLGLSLRNCEQGKLLGQLRGGPIGHGAASERV
jgi:hypothetical protein